MLEFVEHVVILYERSEQLIRSKEDFEAFELLESLLLLADSSTIAAQLDVNVLGLFHVKQSRVY